MGGGGFSMEPENPLLDDYILAQTNKKKPKICFIGTASGDDQSYIDRFYDAFQLKNCITSHLSLFKNIPSNLEDYILSQDIIYVGGGNTRNMMVLWKTWGVDEVLKKAYHNGIILCGLSAGAICWFEEGLTDSFPNEIRSIDCLGILKGSYCPHYDGEKERQEVYKNKIKTNEMKVGYACEDGVALHFMNEKLEKVISSRETANAYLFKAENTILTEELLKPKYLNNIHIKKELNKI